MDMNELKHHKWMTSHSNAVNGLTITLQTRTLFVCLFQQVFALAVGFVLPRAGRGTGCLLLFRKWPKFDVPCVWGEGVTGVQFTFFLVCEMVAFFFV